MDINGDEYNAKNGLFGMKRDINLRLMKVVKKPEDKRSLVGMGTQYYDWKKHYLFDKFNHLPPIIQLKCFDDGEYIVDNGVFKSKEASCYMVVVKPMYKKSGVYRLVMRNYRLYPLNVTDNYGIGLFRKDGNAVDMFDPNIGTDIINKNIVYVIYYSLVNNYMYSNRNKNDIIRYELDTDNNIFRIYMNNFIIYERNLPFVYPFYFTFTVDKTISVEILSLQHFDYTLTQTGKYIIMPQPDHRINWGKK
jgi:hypothetical protein